MKIGFEFRLPRFVWCVDPPEDGGDDGSSAGKEEITIEENLNPEDLAGATLEGDEEHHEEGEGEDKSGEDGKDDDKGKKKEPTLADVLTRLEAAEAKNAELEKAARRAFYQERQEKKAGKQAGKEGDVTLSDAELTAIIEANKDDPKVMLNAVTYKMQQMMKGGVKAAVDEVAVKTKNEQLSTYVKQIVPDIDEEGSKSHEAITKIRGDFSLDDHPHGEFLAWAAGVALQLPQVKQQAFEAGKKAALEEKADGKRKEDIKGGQLGPAGKKGGEGPEKEGSGELSPQEMSTFNLIFGHVKDPKAREAKLKLYRDQIKRGSNKSKAA